LLDPCNINKFVYKCFKCAKRYKKYALKGGCFSKSDEHNQVKPEPNRKIEKNLSLVDDDEENADD
jgi:hypothetical protein